MRIAGRRNKLVTIKSRSDTQNAYGEMVPGWTTFATVYASIDDISGREFVAAAGTQNSVSTKIMIDPIAVLPSMRVDHGSDIYNIEAVLRQRDNSLLLMCSRGVTNG